MTAYCLAPKQNKCNYSDPLDAPTKRRAVYSLMLLGLLLLVVFSYLWQTSSLVGCSYRLDGQKKYQSKINSQTSELEMELAGIQSLRGLRAKAINLGLSPVASVAYLVLPQAPSLVAVQN